MGNKISSRMTDDNELINSQSPTITREDSDSDVDTGDENLGFEQATPKEKKLMSLFFAFK